MPKLVQPAKDSDDEPQRSEGNRSSQEEDDTSSDSDSSDGDGQNQHANKKSNAHQVLPSLGDELNHAKCIQDLSFFKLNWEKHDLNTFHRPNIAEAYNMGSHLSVKVVS